MSLPQYLRRFAQVWLRYAGKQESRRSDAATKRRPVLPRLEVLEDRLTPSGDVLVFTTAAQSLTPYAPSQTIMVQLQDGSGKPVTAASNLTINLSSTSSAGQFLDTSGMALTQPSLTISKGTSSASFEYKDTQMGFATLQAKAPALNLAASQQEAVGVWLNIGTSGSIAYAQPGQPSQPITVELIGQYRPFVAPSAVTVQLTSSSSTGQFLDASGKPLTNGRLTIPAGSNAASFAYKDSQASLSNLSASLDGSSVGTNVNVGTSLVFATPAQSIKAGQPSGTITLRLQDSEGKAVTTPSALSIAVSSNSQTGQILDSSGNPLPSFPFLSIPAGSSSASFKFEDSVRGKPTLTASATVFDEGLSGSQQETVSGPYRVLVGMPGRTIAQNEPSQPITVQLQDSTGNVATATSAVTVQLSSSSSTGQFLDASGKPLSNGLLTIPAGASSTSFEYKDSKAGFPTLTVSANGTKNQMQLNVGVTLAFATPAQTIKAGQTSRRITVRLQDSNGKAVTTTDSLPLFLSFNSQTGQLLDSSGNPLPSPSISIAAGSSSVSFKFKDSMGGTPTLTASAGLMGLGTSLSATQQETVVGPYRVLLETPLAQMTPQNELSQPIAVGLQDSSGMFVKTTSPVTVQLTSSSSTGRFFDTSGNPLPNGRLIIPSGASSASFEYKDSQAGFPTLTAAENGFTSQGSVNVGVSLVFTTPVVNLKAGQTSGTITVQLQDSNGKAFLAPDYEIGSVNSNSLTGQILDTSGNQLSSLSIPAGSSSFSFKYKDSMGGKPTLTAGVFLRVGGELSAMQHETVAGPYRAVFSPAPQTTAIAQNEASQPLTIQLLDSTGKVATATCAVTVQLSSSSPTGQFLDASGKPLTNGRLIIPSGASSARFEYKDSQAGLPTLTASANGFSSPTQVVVGLSLAITTPAQTLKAGQVSQPITVQLQDSHGKAFTAPNALPITLSSSLSTVQFLLPVLGVMPSSIVIPAGASSTSFEITSNWGGKPTLTASVSGMPLAVTQQETIQGLSGVVFTTSPQTLAAGQKSQRVTLQLQDTDGKAAVAPNGGLTIYLFGGSPTPSPGNSSVQFFDANGKPILPIGTFPYLSTAITLPAGSSSVSFAFETTQAGSLPLVAQLLNGPFTEQLETIQTGPPRSLVFLTPAQTLATGAPSGSITVQLQDQYGNPVVAGRGGIPFNLRSSSSGGAFLSADGDPLAGSTITVPQGLSSATFEYKDSRAGTPTLTVSANGLSGSQKESVTPISSEIHVTNTKDSGSGSLRAAIEAANAKPGSTIVFDAGVRGTIDLRSALPTIRANTNILGPGANLLTIEPSAAAQTDFSIFVVDLNSNTTPPVVVLSGLTVANATGTGISNAGYLTLQRMVVKNNQAPNYSWPNGGVFPYGSPGGIANNGSLTILNSTIANNSTTSAGTAAGIDSYGSLLIVNSTITGNKGTNYSRAGGIDISGTALIENSTISGNTAGHLSSSGGGIDCGIDSNNAPVMLYDTLVAGNIGSLNNPTDVSGAFVSLGHNLIGIANPQSSGFLSSDLVGTTAKPIDPRLGALGNNGGPTPTLALRTGSPALGAGSSANAPATDQRGNPRPQGAIDIGAFEETTT